MLKEDFDREYDIHFSGVCPSGISREEKSMGCYNALEKNGDEPTEIKCKRCWKTYIEQQEPPAVNQPDLFVIEQQDLEPGIAQAVNDNIWKLIDEGDTNEV